MRGSASIFLISTGLKAVLGQYKLFTDRNTRDYLARTIGNGDHMHGVSIPHSMPRGDKTDTRVIARE